MRLRSVDALVHLRRDDGDHLASCTRQRRFAVQERSVHPHGVAHRRAVLAHDRHDVPDPSRPPHGGLVLALRDPKSVLGGDLFDEWHRRSIEYRVLTSKQEEVRWVNHPCRLVLPQLLSSSATQLLSYSATQLLLPTLTLHHQGGARCRVGPMRRCGSGLPT